MQFLTASIFKYTSFGLLALCLILAGLWQYEKSGAKKWKARAGYYRSELARISDTKDRQREETGKNIAEAEKQIVFVDRVVTRLESRPLPGNCVTPDLESWREVL